MWDDENAKKGNADAQFNVGMRYFVGFGEAENISEAEKWFNLAAEQGHPEARENLIKIEKMRLEDHR